MRGPDGSSCELFSYADLERRARPDHAADDAGGASNASAGFKGEKRSNEPRRSTTDPDAMLYREGRTRRPSCASLGTS